MSTEMLDEGSDSAQLRIESISGGALLRQTKLPLFPGTLSYIPRLDIEIEEKIL